MKKTLFGLAVLAAVLALAYYINDPADPYRMAR